MKNFNFKTATSTKDAAKLISGRATFLAGGMSLLPAMKLRLAAYTDLINIKKIKTLNGIKVSGKSLTEFLSEFAIFSPITSELFSLFLIIYFKRKF